MLDIIGDVHGCYDELLGLLEKLGYTVDGGNYTAVPPDGRRAVFLGDLCDRGPKNMEVLRLVMDMVKSGTALCLIGNHDNSLLRKMRDLDDIECIGLDITLEQLDSQDESFKADTEEFLDSLPFYYAYDDGNLYIVHAGLPEKYQGEDSEPARTFSLSGNPTEALNEHGSYLREPWVHEYTGKALVVYGHFVTPVAEIVNNTICIDTGCVYGDRLTAFRYPERELVQVEARQKYYRRPGETS
jgi:protein phosphatase